MSLKKVSVNKAVISMEEPKKQRKLGTGEERERKTRNPPSCKSQLACATSMGLHIGVCR
jgi:hypothetical protein